MLIPDLLYQWGCIESHKVTIAKKSPEMGDAHIH